MATNKYRKALGAELVALDDKSSIDECKTWSPEQLTTFVEKNGVSVGDAMIRHNISGDVFHLMARQDFVDIGIICVGDILRLMHIVEILQKTERVRERDELHWEGKEYRPSLCENLCCHYSFCCFICMPKLDSYKITSTSIHQTSTIPATCCFCIEMERGCFASVLRGCCGTEYATNRTDIAAILDVDINERTTGCLYRCFGVKGIDDVLITTDLQGDQSSVTMHVKQGQGAEVLSILRDMQAERAHMRLPGGNGLRRRPGGGDV